MPVGHFCQSVSLVCLLLCVSCHLSSVVWNILGWNVCGLNAGTKWNSIKNKIEESAASVFCLQETKKSLFDFSFIRNIAPRRLDHFARVLLLGLLVDFWSFGTVAYLRA